MHAVRDLSGGTLLTIITKFAVLLDSTEMLRTFSASALICHLFFDAGDSPSIEAEIIRKLVIYFVDILLFEVMDPSFACSLASECFMEM